MTSTRPRASINAPARRNTAATDPWTPQQLAQLANAYSAKNPGWTPPGGTIPGVTKTPGTAATPGTPPVPSAPVAPFWTGGDLQDYANNKDHYSQGNTDIDSKLTDLAANTKYSLAQLTSNFAKNQENSVDGMIGRGLFNSSVKDAALVDLNTTYGLAKSQFDDALSVATANATIAHQQLSDWWSTWQKGYNQRGEENAQGVTPTPDTPGTPGTPGTPPTYTATPAAASTNPFPTTGNQWADAWLAKNPGQALPSSGETAPTATGGSAQPVSGGGASPPTGVNAAPLPGGYVQNTVSGNLRQGQYYTTVKQGGVTYHQYQDGTKVAVK